MPAWFIGKLAGTGSDSSPSSAGVALALAAPTTTSTNLVGIAHTLEATAAAGVEEKKESFEGYEV